MKHLTAITAIEGQRKKSGRERGKELHPRKKMSHTVWHLALNSSCQPESSFEVYSKLQEE